MCYYLTSKVTGSETDDRTDVTTHVLADISTQHVSIRFLPSDLYFTILQISQKQRYSKIKPYLHQSQEKMRFFLLFVAWLCACAAAGVEAVTETTTKYYRATSGQQLADDVTLDESAVHNDLSCASRCADDVSCVTFTVCRQAAGKQWQQCQVLTNSLRYCPTAIVYETEPPRGLALASKAADSHVHVLVHVAAAGLC